MADAKITLEVLLQAAGIKPTTAQLKNLNKEMQKTAGRTKKVANASNKLKRNLEGVAQRAGSTGKDFSRMSQGMGGLVQAYATVAANVFALSSAFLVLRRAADLSSMTKSAEDFSNRFGVSVTRITRQMQVASGGALSFAEALPTINKAISAGIGVEQMEQLTIAATKAAQTFGGSTTEALSRFISAAQRGRVEIIQTLGIVIKTEQAYKDFAATVGKTALELTALDRQQAILNATIKESQSIFDQVTIDPNPFQQMLTTLIDVKDIMLTFITDAITPMINAFNQSKFAAAALIAVMLKLVGGKIFGQVAIGITAAAKAGKQSTAQARILEQKAEDTARRRDKRITVSARAAKREAIAFENGLKKQAKAHASFTKKILIQEKGLNIGVATERRAALSRNIKSLEGGGKAFAGLPGLEASKRQLLVIDRLLLSVTGSAGKANQSMANMGKTLAATTTKGIRNLSIIEARLASTAARSAAVSSALKTGFAQGFQIAEGRVVKSIKGMTVAWRIFIRDIGSGAVKAKSNLVNFGLAMGRTAGIVTAGLSKLLSAATSFFLIFTIGAAIWEKYGDAIRGITPEMRAVMGAQKEFKDALEEVNARAAEGIVRLGTEFPASLKKLQDALKFTAGTFASINTAIINFQIVTLTQLRGLSITEAAERLEKLKKRAEELNAIRESLVNSANNVGAVGFIGTGGLSVSIGLTERQAEELEKLDVQIESIESTFKGLSDTITSELVKSLVLAKTTAKAAGFEQFGQLLITELNKGISKSKIDINLGERLSLVVAALQTDTDEFEKIMEGIKKRLGDDVAFNIFSENVFKAIQGFLSVGEEATRTIDSSLSSLADVENRIGNFVSGLDKARSATGPNKEIAGFILDINRELKALDENQKGLTGNITLAKLFADPEELAKIKQLLGFAVGEVVQLGKALTEAEKRQITILKATEARLLGTKRLKIQAIQLATLNKEEADVDADRITKLERRLVIQKNIADIAVDNATAAFNEQKDKLSALEAIEDTTKETLNIETAQRNVLYQQVVAAQAHRNILEENMDALREHLKIIKEVFTTQLKLNGIEKQKTTINIGLSTSLADNLKLRERLFKIQRQEISLKRSQAVSDLAGLGILGLTVEQEQRRTEELKGQLDVLNLQEAALIRQQEGNLALRIEERGTTIFSQRAIDLTAHFFRRAFEKEIPKLKSAFEILGEGFSKTVIDTFDTVIDNLLEGGKDFGQVVREALKASLRDVVGDALKNDMRKIFLLATKNIGNAFKSEEERAQGEFKASQAANKPALTEARATKTAAFQTVMTEKTEQQRVLQDRMATSLDSIATTSASCCGSQTATIAKVESSPDIGKEVAKGIEGSTVDVETVNNSPTMEAAVVGMGNLIAAGAENNTAGMLQAFINLGQLLISAMAAQKAADTASSVASNAANFFGTGGIISGGMSKPVALAGGGVINQPSLALIGEGKNNEAVVPLPNNKEIPVDLKGVTGDTINIEQSFDFTNANTDTISALRGEARAIEDRTFNRVFTEINKGGKYAKIVGRR